MHVTAAQSCRFIFSLATHTLQSAPKMHINASCRKTGKQRAQANTRTFGWKYCSYLDPLFKIFEKLGNFPLCFYGQSVQLTFPAVNYRKLLNLTGPSSRCASDLIAFCKQTEDWESFTTIWFDSDVARGLTAVIRG